MRTDFSKLSRYDDKQSFVLSLQRASLVEASRVVLSRWASIIIIFDSFKRDQIKRN